MKKPEILVVGSMNMDLMIYGMQKLPQFGESVQGGSYRYVTGGKGCNQAIAAARQGAAVTMVGRVGNDDNGRMLIDQLKESGVDTDFVVSDDEAQTGFDPILVDGSGRYISVVVMGANNWLSPQDVERALDTKHFDIVLMQLEMPLETVYRTYEMAAKKNIPVFLDAGPAMSIPLERLKGIFIISPNEAETKALTGVDVVDRASALKASKILYQAANPRYVLLKMGERGAFLYDGNESRLTPAFQVNAVDSTAAGDTFGAALSVRLCAGDSMEKAILFANAAAGICVSRQGAHPSIPSAEEVQAFLEERTGGEA